MSSKHKAAKESRSGRPQPRSKGIKTKAQQRNLFHEKNGYPGSSHGTSIEQICRDFGRGSSEMGCVVISLAHILGWTEQEVCGKFLGGTLPKPREDIKGITFEEIEQLILELPMQSIEFPSSGNENWPAHNRRAIKLLIERMSNHEGQEFAIGFRRENGSGHCVVGRKRPQREGDCLTDYDFWCYQQHRDAFNDVDQSFLEFAIFSEPSSRSHAIQNGFYDNDHLPALRSNTAALVQNDCNSSYSFATSCPAPYHVEQPNTWSYYVPPGEPDETEDEGFDTMDELSRGLGNLYY